MNPDKPLLQVEPTFKNLLIFQLFFFCMHELHELTHVITGRLICGGWGTRDFNVWDLCKTCNVTYPQIATFAGPLFTFAMLWLGRYLIKNSSFTRVGSFGLVMILGNMPFGRVYMAAMGSGDEAFGLRSLLLNAGHSNLLIIRLLNFVIVTLICLPPLITAYHCMANKHKLLLFAALLIVPLILDTVILLICLNGILSKGFLARVYFMGTPVLIQAWFITCVLIVTVNYKHLTHFAQKKNINYSSL